MPDSPALFDDSQSYIGRFAPSPTGPLHLGSLYTALASYLDARHHAGIWLLRIDDLDTLRNMPGAADAILDCLLGFGLAWDGAVYYQSSHLSSYADAIKQLQMQDKVFACACSRKVLQDFPGVYPGFCRENNLAETNNALRLKCPDTLPAFCDGLQGLIEENMALSHGDFIIKRRDGVIAYQLAVVVDDYRQGVNQVVRGADLLDSTLKQVFLQQLLVYPQPHYQHVPVIVDAAGNKLSKQTLAQAVNELNPGPLLFDLLGLLRQNPPPGLRFASKRDILDWAIAHWQPQFLQKTRAIPQTID